jgi:hypothetical protein
MNRESDDGVTIRSWPIHVLTTLRAKSDEIERTIEAYAAIFVAANSLSTGLRLLRQVVRRTPDR